MCVRLLVKLLGDYLNELTYPAELAGLSYSVSNHLAGFQVRREVLLLYTCCCVVLWRLLVVVGGLACRYDVLCWFHMAVQMPPTLSLPNLGLLPCFTPTNT